MTVRGRLVLTFVLVGTVLVLPAVFAANRLAELRDLAVEGRGRQAEAAEAAGRIDTELVEMTADFRAYVGAPDSLLRLAAFRSLARVETDLPRLAALVPGQGAQSALAALESLVLEAVTIGSLVDRGLLDDATDRYAVLDAAASRVRRELNNLQREIDLQAQDDFERARVISLAARVNTLVGVLAALVISLVFAGWTTRWVSDPLRRLQRAHAAVTRGKFRAPSDLPYERTDEIGDLAVSFEAMTRRLRELDRLKAEFISVASHELKTPINVIRGYTELIEEELQSDLTEHQRDVLQRIGHQVATLSSKVSRLMDISRLEAGEYAMEFERTLLEDLLLGVVRSYELAAREKDVELVLDIGPGAPETLTLDVDLIRDEVLGNLVSNAVKFTPPGSTVWIRARGEGGWAVLDVVDQGPGIPPEHRVHVFEKYYQVHRSRAMGSGLGLAIAKEMVVAHGGSIELVDDGSQGATFRVRLPLARAESESGPGQDED